MTDDRTFTSGNGTLPLGDSKTPVDNATTADGGVSFEPAPALAPLGHVAFEPAATGTGAAPLEDETKRTAKETIKQEAGKLGEQAADRARSFAGDGKARATGALDEFSKMMNDAAGTVDEKLGEQYGQYARSAAQSIGGFADTLRAKEIDELMEDAREFVRKSPAIAIGTAAALGFVFARIIKAGVDGVADAGDPTDPGATSRM